MRLRLTDEERAELQARLRASRNVRHWRRYHAVLLRADGVPGALTTRPPPLLWSAQLKV